MAAGLVRALTDEAARSQVVANAKKLYETAYSRPVYEAKMRAVLERLGASQPARRQPVASHGKT
jgi:hypothetical protein